MAQATVSARIDSKDKEKFDKFCDNVGLSTSAAIYMFIKNVINEHRTERNKDFCPSPVGEKV